MTEHYQTEAEIAKVRQMLQDGLTKSKIMELTGLADRTIRNYTHIIHERDKELWKDQANESLENRAIIIKKKYQDLADVCDTILKDEKKSPRDRIEAGKTSVACENNIYNMIKEGPLRFNNIVTGKEVKRLPEADNTLPGEDKSE